MGGLFEGCFEIDIGLAGVGEGVGELGQFASQSFAGLKVRLGRPGLCGIVGGGEGGGQDRRFGQGFARLGQLPQDAPGGPLGALQTLYLRQIATSVIAASAVLWSPSQLCEGRPKKPVICSSNP